MGAGEGAALDHLLFDQQVLAGARRDLRRMRHRQHLDAFCQSRQPSPDGVGDGAADARIDFVEDQHRRRSAIREHDLERQQKPAQLATGGDLHQRSCQRARIGLHMNPIESKPLGDTLPSSTCWSTAKRAAPSLRSGSSASTALLSALAAFALAPLSRAAAAT